MVSISSLISIFLISSYWFGVIFYDFIQDHLNFSYTDEFLSLFLLVFCILLFFTKKRGVPYNLLIFFFISIFYLLYSFYINSNVSKAIFYDYLVIAKPFIAFFSILVLRVTIRDNIKLLLGVNAVFGAFLLPFLYNIYPNPARFATAATATAFLYLYSFPFTNKNKIIFISILIIGAMSGRTKILLFILFASTFIVLIKVYGSSLFKFTLRNAFLFFVLLVLGYFISYQKLYYYFYEGVFLREEIFARPALYLTSIQIATDFFPFGSGLASFATFFSGQYYSDIYSTYNINHIHGLTLENPNFIADTFFPAILGQFGLFGLFSFFYFWYRVIKKSIFLFLNDRSLDKQFYAVLMITFFFFIESLVDSTFAQNRGMFMMVLMGLFMSEMKFSEVGKY